MNAADTTPSPLGYLKQDQIDKFQRDGYLVIPGFLSSEDTRALLDRSKELLEEFSLDDHPLTRFTISDDKHVGDEYFLTSGDKIRYFLEVDAVNEHGKLTTDKTKAVNKIGHALHELDPVFRKVTLENQRLKQLICDLHFHRDPAALQSMVIVKQPSIGGEVPEHNDSTFLASDLTQYRSLKRADHTHCLQYTDPPSALGFWIALEQCTESNGALSFLPGSHLTTPVTKRFVRLPNGGTGFEGLPHSAGLQHLGSAGEYVLEPCAPGDLVLIHGNVLHKSSRNTSPHTRFAYTFHMIESPPFAYYDEKNWLQPTQAMPFSRLLNRPIGSAEANDA